MAKMKYVVVNSEECGKQVVAFPCSIEYDNMASVLNYIKFGSDRNWKRLKREKISEGTFDTNEPNEIVFSSEMKYVVVKSEDVGKQMFIFPKNINHDRMAEVLSEIEELANGEMDNFYRSPISAGFVDGFKCYGVSETLNLKSNENDSELLKLGGCS